MILLPRDGTISIVERAYTCRNGYCYNSSWYSWQRWVVLGVLLVVGFFLFFCCTCLTARRRRRRGLQPFYGTAWAAPPAYDVHNVGNTGPQYGGQTGTGYNSGQQYAAHTHTSPPDYSPPSNAGYYNQQAGTTGGPQSGFEMGGGGVGTSGGFNQPRSPPQAHVTKY